MKEGYTRSILLLDIHFGVLCTDQLWIDFTECVQYKQCPRCIMFFLKKNILLNVVSQSDGIISPARTLQEVVRRGIVIYHGAEPAIELSSPSSPINDKNEFRKDFGLPLDKMLLLAFGYAGSYKGFDVLDSLILPDGWSLVVKQTKHERGLEKPIEIGKNNGDNVISLNLGYLDDTTMSKLFFACDAIIFPYKIVSVSGVMFDALAHGLPFIASDLRFFKEFADMGLG